MNDVKYHNLLSLIKDNINSIVIYNNSSYSLNYFISVFNNFNLLPVYLQDHSYYLFNKLIESVNQSSPVGYLSQQISERLHSITNCDLLITLTEDNKELWLVLIVYKTLKQVVVDINKLQPFSEKQLVAKLMDHLADLFQIT